MQSSIGLKFYEIQKKNTIENTMPTRNDSHIIFPLTPTEQLKTHK